MALCVCDGPPHQYDPAWCVSGLKPARGEVRAPSTSIPPLVPQTSRLTASSSVIEVVVTVDGVRYSQQMVGYAHDARFATQVGRAVAVAILEHGARRR